MNTEPQVNQVWRTKLGRLALIVDLRVEGKLLAILWYDDISKEWIISEIFDRLEYQLPKLTPLQFFIEVTSSDEPQ